MRLIAAMLLLFGISSVIAVSQQPPPPPPPQPDAAQQTQAPSSQTGNTQAPAAQQSPTQPGTPPQPDAAQQTQTPQGENTQPQAAPQQSPTQPVSPTQPDAAQQTQTPQGENAQPQSAPQQSPTQPIVPTPPPRQGAQDVNLPEKEQLEAELGRIQAQEERVAVRGKIETRLRESRVVVKELQSGKLGIPNALLQRAKCVVVIPAVKKAAFAFGVKYGRGVMSCRLGEDFTGPWSAPAMYALEGGNFGLQIGLQGTDLVLLVMNPRGVDSLLGTKAKLGGDASLSAGPIGRNMEASTDLAMRAKILAYSRSHGLFAGVSLDGSTLRPDNFANRVLYGREITARRILRQGGVAVSRDGEPLIRLLDQSVNIASNNTMTREAQK